VPVRRRRAISSLLLIYSPDGCGRCQAPQNAHRRTPSGMSDPQSLQFMSFSSSNCGSFACSRTLRDRQTQPTSSITIKPAAEIAKV